MNKMAQMPIGFIVKYNFKFDISIKSILQLNKKIFAKSIFILVSLNTSIFINTFFYKMHYGAIEPST